MTNNNKPDLLLILLRRFANDQWVLDGDDYAGLSWLSASAKPTKKQLESLWPEISYEFEVEQVEQNRAAAYRETSDALFFEYQRGDATEAEWLAAVQAVKDAHPYPEQV
jgi:hypothetical protein